MSVLKKVTFSFLLLVSVISSAKQFFAIANSPAKQSSACDTNAGSTGQ